MASTLEYFPARATFSFSAYNGATVVLLTMTAAVAIWQASEDLWVANEFATDVNQVAAFGQRNVYGLRAPELS